MLAPPAEADRAALVASIAPERFRAFRAVFGGDSRQVLDLYILDIELAAEIHNLTAVLEVTLRQAVHLALTVQFGPRWFDQAAGLLDDRSQHDIATAVSKVRRRTPPPGKVGAELMFGTWTNLLDAGGWASNPAAAPGAGSTTNKPYRPRP